LRTKKISAPCRRAESSSQWRE